MTDKIYGVIVEWKEEGPLVMEGQLQSYDDAAKRRSLFAARHDVIRVAIFKAVYQSGNSALIPMESAEA